MTELHVSEIMTKRPVTIDKSKSIVESAKLMKKNRISSLIDLSKNKLVGIITVDDVTSGCVIDIPVTISAPGFPLQALVDAQTLNLCFGDTMDDVKYISG